MGCSKTLNPHAPTSAAAANAEPMVGWWAAVQLDLDVALQWSTPKSSRMSFASRPKRSYESDRLW